MAETRDPRINRRMDGDLEALRARDQFRDLASPPGIQLSSNDYLGLSSDPRLKDAITRALEADDRVSSTGSRLLSGNSERWEQLEQRFAEFVGTEAALYFPSGYAANIGLLSSILKDGDTVFSDSANHASVIDGIRLSRANRVIFPHSNLDYLAESLHRTGGRGEKIIVVESVFSMDGDRAPLRELIALCEQYGASLIADEAHAIGVEGLGGRGLVHSIRRNDHVLATVHTCGKALASMGAFVAGSRTLRDYLINHARTFIFTTALPPYCAAQIQEALSLSITADADRDHLYELSRHLRKRMKRAGFETGRSNSQIIPLILGSNDAAVRFAAAMNAAGFAVRAIRPPSVPAGTSRLRLSLHSKLSFAEMDAFTDTLIAVRESEVVPE
ncbi:MAG TPA: 8-amino-7-oxononanoate synthase [Terriglobia bacterium]|nr:8-amino-7-oxononanoate synthase [Terriglobia bacterium]